MQTTNKKKILLIVVGILLTLGIVVGVSYAWWTHTISQESVNTIQSTCLEIELSDETSAIHLPNAYPITDLEASFLTPYTFTIKNKCNTMIEYDVNLDIMESKDSEGKDNRLSSSYIAIEFNGGAKKLLNTLEARTPTYKKAATETEAAMEAVEGRYLTSGELGSNGSISYTIKLWMDESVDVEDDAMNKNFISKVVVTAKQIHAVRIADMVQLGEYVEMTPTSTSYTVPTSMTGYSSDQTINPSELNLWRVIKKNDDGTMDMISEYVSSKVLYLYGLTGYRRLVDTLQNVASQYANEKYTIKTRHFGYNNQLYVVDTPTASNCGGGIRGGTTGNSDFPENKGCGDILDVKDRTEINSILGTLKANIVNTENSGSYWICTRKFWSEVSTVFGYVESISADGSYFVATFNNENYLYTTYFPNVPALGYRIRPIVTLKANVIYKSGNGTQESPYKISANE